MAVGDWAPGTRMTNRRAEVVIDEDGHVIHCGLGYHLQAPSGRIVNASGGHTWGGPDAQPAEPWRDRLQACMDELMREAAETEGLGS